MRAAIASALFCLFFLHAVAQEPMHGTIRIGKKSDSVVVSTMTEFFVYKDVSPYRQGASYRDIVAGMTEKNAAGEYPRMKILEAAPKGVKEGFDFTAWFSNHAACKKVKLRGKESDTVKLLVHVDPLGVVQYVVLSPVSSDAAGPYRLTQQAFSDLLKNKWRPAQIWQLKKNPSKQREPYTKSNAHMEGVLSVIYSLAPADN